MPDSNNINETEATIEECLQAFKSATYGEEVRDALIRVARLCYSLSMPIHLDNNNDDGDYILYYEDFEGNRTEVFNFSNYYPRNPQINGDAIQKNLVVVSEPEDFSWKDSPIHNKILTDYNGEFKVDLDVVSFKNTGGIEIYISPDGNDSNDGTLEHPKKTLSAAYNTTNVKTIYVLPGIYSRPSTLFGTKITKNINIIGVNDGGEVFITTHANSNMTEYIDPSYPNGTNTYYATRGHLTHVVDMLNLDEDGFYTLYNEMPSLDLCIQNEGSWYFDTSASPSSIAYVHTIGGINIAPTTANGILLLNEDVASSDTNHLSSMFEITNGNVYLENLTCIGGPTVLHAHKENNNEINLYAKNCKFLVSKGYYSSGGAHYDRNTVWIKGAKLAYFQNCVAALSESDGFNYNPLSGTITKAIEVNCIGCKNGSGNNANDQGSTIHAGCKIIRVHDICSKNIGPGFADVGNGPTEDDPTKAISISESWNIGCVSFENRATGAASGDSQKSNFLALPYSKVFCDSCIGFNSKYNVANDIIAWTDGTGDHEVSGSIYLRNTNNFNPNDFEHFIIGQGEQPPAFFNNGDVSNIHYY